MPTLTREERIGSVVGGRYNIVRLIGEGGMGTVFEAVHAYTKRRVAVKLMLPEYATRENAVARFMQEAQSAAAINHPNIVQVLDMGVDEQKTLFLVLEFLEGEDLGARLKREERIAPLEIAGIVLPVMEALAAAHAKGIVHRDLKPGNILLARQENGSVVPKLLDFGISKISGENAMARTGTGHVLGTPLYMSPEQARGERNVDHQVDVWAMGVLLYECLGANFPFVADNYNEMILRLITAEATPLASIAPDVPPALCAIVHGALVKERAGRYATMADFARALAAWSGLATTLSADASRGTGASARLSSSGVDATGRQRLPTPAPMVTPSPAAPSAPPMPPTSVHDQPPTGMAWQRPLSTSAVVAPVAKSRRSWIIPVAAVALIGVGITVAFVRSGSDTGHSTAARAVSRPPTEAAAAAHSLPPTANPVEHTRPTASTVAPPAVAPPIAAPLRVAPPVVSPPVVAPPSVVAHSREHGPHRRGEPPAATPSLVAAPTAAPSPSVARPAIASTRTVAPPTAAPAAATRGAAPAATAPGSPTILRWGQQ